MKAPCLVGGCPREVRSRGYCGAHLERLRKYGTTELPPKPSLEDQFWAAVDKGDGCWLWTGHRNDGGYGQFKRNILAHRFSYQLHRGPIPEGLITDHLCHSRDLSCPGGPTCLHRRCVKPDHMELVTNAENIRRGLWGRKARAKKAVPTCKRNHPFDEANTRFTPRGYRVCVTCKNLRKADWRRRCGMTPLAEIAFPQELRNEALAMFHQGLSQAAIARELGTSRACVGRWVKLASLEDWR